MEDDDLAKLVGANVRAAREAAGWTQKRLSAACGIPTPHLSRLESGAHLPTLTTVNKIANALGMEADELLRPAPKPKRGKK